METDRGRWFLAELARRHKSADTETLLKAIHKLETAITEHMPAAGNDALGREFSAMAAALRATEADMRKVSSDRLADGGAVPEGRTAFEDVGVRAKSLAAGLDATTEALKSASDDLKQDPATAGRIAGLDDDLSRLAEYNVTQTMLSQRITRAMDLIAHLQERIQASLAPDEEPQGQVSEDSPAPDEAVSAGETLSAGEINYFDADRELFTPPEAAPAPAPEMAADDPENAPHLADMLEDALASMQLGGDAEPAAPEAAQSPEAEEAALAPPEPEVQPAQPPADEPPFAAPPQAVADEVPGDDEAARTRRVVIVREPPAAPPPSSSGGEAEAANPCQPVASEEAQASAAEGPDAPADADADMIVFAELEAPADAASEAQAATEPEASAATEPEAPVAEEPEAPAPAEAAQAAPASGSEEEAGPEAIMKMFAEAAARHGMQPDAPAPGDSEAGAASEDEQTEPAAEQKEVKAAPLEPMTPGAEERRRIVVIRRGSSADTSIPLEESDNNVTEAKA